VESSIIGFHDISQIRYLYVPLGILSNEWVTVLLCLLPYPMLGLYIAYRATEYGLNFKSLPPSWIKWIFIITIGLIDFNILITFSRAGMLSLFLFHILLLGILFTDSIEKKRLLLYVEGVFFTVFLLFTVVFFQPVQSGLNASVSHQRSTYGRLAQWRDALDIVLLKPVVGVGAGNYALISGKWQNVKEDASFTGRVNNSYLQLLIENGIIGFILWSLFFFLLISNLLRRIRCKKDIKSIIIAACLASLLFRELFFSSLFYNGGVLLLLLLPVFIFYEDMPRQVVYKLNKSQITVFLIFTSLSFYYYVDYRYERMEYKEAIAKNEMFSKTESAFGNSLLYASLGLQIERSSAFPIDSVIFLHFNPNENNAFPGWSDAIKHYKVACEINPYDDLFFHNLAWLYFGSNKKDSALLYISCFKSLP
ncbi:MAG: O-antigen ligase family protein, partial [Parabacteroides sp.]|nr:O-antigen ligase family protein [Parabacteroides sp.]